MHAAMHSEICICTLQFSKQHILLDSWRKSGMAVCQIEIVAVSLLFKTDVYYSQGCENEKYMQENVKLNSNFIACVVFV